MSVTTPTRSSAGGTSPRPTSRRATPKPRRRATPAAGLTSKVAPWWLLTPGGIVVIALLVVPILFLIYTSFTTYDQRTLFTGEYDFTGFSQYARIFTDPEFWMALVRTVVFTVTMVFGSVVIGMAIAQLLTRVSGTMRYVVTVVLVIAWAMPNVASSQVWLWLFQPGYGVVNWLITQLGVFGDFTNVNWAQDARFAFLSIWMLVVWQAVPFIALTLYAAQAQVPADYMEAARLDGASEWRIYWSVMLPAVRPTLLLVIVLSIIWDFNVFNQIWLVSQGGPGAATTTLGIYSYKTAFIGFDIGEGAAVALVTTVLLLVFSALYIRSLIRSGEDL
ncbi:carbohydrate ABC transporter permease [Microbacterium sp.]|uniref:carbohydrate ABC transporter permease n=1 Tax=Microbacterium sp. TaxID=51671 RepID=UPI003A87DA32